MKANDYINSIDKLEFDQNLASRVWAVEQGRPKFRMLRTVVLGAILCVILVITALADNQWARWNIKKENLGSIQPDVEQAEKMVFASDGDFDGIRVYTMELNGDSYFLFGHGLLYSNKSGFLRVEPDYSLTGLECREIPLSMEKDGFSYSHNLRFVETENGLVSDQMFFYTLVDGKVLVNLWDNNERCWPVWLDVSTGVCEDALPDFHAEDFEGTIRYAQTFREGILLTGLTANQQRNVYYWIQSGFDTAVELEIPAGSMDYVADDALYLRDARGIFSELQSDWTFTLIEDIQPTFDDVQQGLVTCARADDTLQIYDLLNRAVYASSDVVSGGSEDSRYAATGFRASRYCADGEIVVTHSFHDWENLRKMVDSIAWLDRENMELKQLEIQSGQGVWTHGWLDGHRYCVISEDGIARWLTVYEFGA